MAEMCGILPSILIDSRVLSDLAESVLSVVFQLTKKSLELRMNMLRRLMLITLLVLLLCPVASNAQTSEVSMLDQARRQFSAGEYYFATNWLEKILKSYPATPHREEVLVMMSKAYASTDRDEKAIQALRTLLKDYPKAAATLDPKLVKMSGFSQEQLEKASREAAAASASAERAKKTTASHPVDESAKLAAAPAPGPEVNESAKVAPVPVMVKEKVKEPAASPSVSSVLLVPKSAVPVAKIQWRGWMWEPKAAPQASEPSGQQPSPAPVKPTQKTVAAPPVAGPAAAPVTSIPVPQKVSEPTMKHDVSASPRALEPPSLPAAPTAKNAAYLPVVEPLVEPTVKPDVKPDVKPVVVEPVAVDPVVKPAALPVAPVASAPKVSDPAEPTPVPPSETPVAILPAVPVRRKEMTPVEPPAVEPAVRKVEDTGLTGTPDQAVETVEPPAVEPAVRKMEDTRSTGTSDQAVETAMYSLDLGEYVVKSAMADAEKKLRKMGQVPVVEEGPKRKEPMLRLYAGAFPNLEAAKKQQEKLRANNVESFILLERDRKSHLYTGSYSDQNAAAKQQKRLADLGIKVSLKKVVVSVPTFHLTAGSFPTRGAALEVAAELEKQGVKSVVVQRSTAATPVIAAKSAASGVN
jgi:hypothetical protein